MTVLVLQSKGASYDDAFSARSAYIHWSEYNSETSELYTGWKAGVIYFPLHLADSHLDYEKEETVMEMLTVLKLL